MNVIGRLAALLGTGGKKRTPVRRTPRQAISELPAERPAKKQAFGRAGMQADATQKKPATKRGRLGPWS